jgi:hypothetical protein
MRLRLILGLGLITGLAWLSSAAWAQGNAASTPRSAALRRHNMRDPRLVGEEAYAPDSRSAPPQAPVSPSYPSARHNYYPAARTGHSSNRNVVDTRTLCNPARRALLMR